MIRSIIIDIEEKKKDKESEKRKSDNPNKPTKIHNKHIPNRPLTNDILKKFGRP